MYKPSLYARLFYSVETLKLLEMLYRDSTEIHSWASGYSTTYKICVYNDSDQKAVEITFYTDSWTMCSEFYDSTGKLVDNCVYTKCPSVFYMHVKELFDKLKKRMRARHEQNEKAKLVNALTSVDLSAKRLTVDPS